MAIHPSFCRFCHNGCPILVEVEDGRAVRVTGDHDNELYFGYTCVKGRAQPKEHAHPDRLLMSQRRSAVGFEPISSAQAMDEVAAKLQGVIDRHGPNSVATYLGTKASTSPTTGVLVLSLADAIGSSMRFTSDTIDQPGKHVAKGLHGVWMGGAQGFDRPEAGLIIGANPLVTYAGGLPTGSPGAWLQRWLDDGFQLVVVDPRRTDLAKRATIHLQLRPGEDVSVIAGMIRFILAEGLQDDEFLAGEVIGVEALRAAVEPFTPEVVAARTDIDRDDLVRAARVFARAGRGYAVASTGPNMSGHGTLFEYLVLSLNTICGRWLRAGEQVASPLSLTPEVMPVKAQATGQLPAYGLGDPLKATGLTASLGGLPTAAVPDEILGGNIRALISIGGNPAVAWPDQLRTVKAMRELDLLVQIDVRMSATAKLAHYVIAPTMSLEAPSMTAFQELMPLYGASYGGWVKPWAQWTDAVVDPPPGSDLLAEWEFFYGVGQRMGLKMQLGPPYEFVQTPKVPLDMENKPTTEEVLYLMAKGARISLDDVRVHPRGSIFPDPPVFVAEKDPGWEARLDVGNQQMMTDLGTVADSSAPGVGEFPFRLISRRVQHAYNSTGHDIRASRKGSYNPAFMNPADLADLGLSDGDHVEIRSGTAAIRAIVGSDEGLRRGLVSMTHAYGDVPELDHDVQRTGSNTSRLVNVEWFQPYTGQPLMSNVPIDVLPLTSATPTPRPASIPPARF